MRTASVRLRTVSVRIGTTSTTGFPLSKISIVEVVPLRTETVCKRTEAVCKQCKYGIRLQQAQSVLCPCVRGIFPVYSVWDNTVRKTHVDTEVHMLSTGYIKVIPFRACVHTNHDHL